MNNFRFSRTLLLVVSIAFSGASISQVKTAVSDTSVFFEFEITDEVEWDFSSEVDTSLGNSVTCAATPDSVSPPTIICATTKLAANDLAVQIPAVGIASQKVFLKGVCLAYQCRDETGIVKSEEFTDKAYAEVKGYEFASLLKHPEYVENGLSDSVFFITMTPTGQLQLFSLHTDIGNVEKYLSVFEAAIATTRYTAKQ